MQKHKLEETILTFIFPPVGRALDAVIQEEENSINFDIMIPKLILFGHNLRLPTHRNGKRLAGVSIKTSIKSNTKSSITPNNVILLLIPTGTAA